MSSGQTAGNGRHVVCNVSDVPAGGRVLVQLGRISVGIFNIGGQILAIRNLCPHALTPIFEGAICGAVISDVPHERHLAFEGRILKCPWHGWEFVLPEGVTLTHPEKRLLMYPVDIENGKVIVQTSTRPSRTPESVDA